MRLNVEKMMSNKNKSVQVLTKGVEFLFKKNKVNYLKGKGVIFSPTNVVVYEQGKKTSYNTKNIVIATGSHASSLPGVKINEKNIISSTAALSLSSVPKSLVVIGGGYIGLEMGSVWKRLGSEVTVIENLPFITPGMDREVSNEFQKILTKQGIKFKLNSKVLSIKDLGNEVKIEYQSNEKNSKEIISADKTLIAVGRKPYTEGLNLQKIGVKKDDKGRIKVNKKFQTDVKNIYAIGDVIEGPMLAHKASAEGHVFAERLAGNSPVLNYGCIPAVIYTEPEVAWVGPTEKELQQKGITYKKGVFPFTANARAKTTGDTEGNIKVLSHPKNDKIIAVHIIGAHAGELIGEAATALEAGLSAEDIALICHAHPTLSESMKEAASLASIGKTLHF